MIGFLSVRRLVCAIALSSLGAPGAFAACYEGLGCTDRNPFSYNRLVANPDCEYLFVMRNRIYKDHGYCFHTSHAIHSLGNEGCYTSDMGSVAMSPLERGNATTILSAEKALGCGQ